MFVSFVLLNVTFLSYLFILFFFLFVSLYTHFDLRLCLETASAGRLYCVADVFICLLCSFEGE